MKKKRNYGNYSRTVHIETRLHRRLAVEAAEAGIPIQELVNNLLRGAITIKDEVIHS